jgi:hypothetical protein
MRTTPLLRTMRAHLAWIVGVLLLAVVIGLIVRSDLRTTSAGECRDQEAHDYPLLEKTAHDVLGDLGDRFTRYSFCEDTQVKPGAEVRVSVYDWTTGAQARTYFLRSGTGAQRTATDPSNYVLHTVDGKVGVRFIRAVDYLENNGDRFVSVVFSPGS